jgi:hypothetical protein
MLNDKWEILRKPNQEIMGVKYNGININTSNVAFTYDVGDMCPTLIIQVPAYDLTFTEVSDA